MFMAAHSIFVVGAVTKTAKWSREARISSCRNAQMEQPHKRCRTSQQKESIDSRLTDDLLLIVFRFANVKDLVQLYLTCRRWHTLLSEIMVDRGQQWIQRFCPRQASVLHFTAASTSFLWSVYNDAFWARVKFCWRPVEFMQLYGHFKTLLMLDQAEEEAHRACNYFGRMEEQDEDLEFADDEARESYLTEREQDLIPLSNEARVKEVAQSRWIGALNDDKWPNAI